MRKRVKPTNGYKSGLEANVAVQLKGEGIAFKYEAISLPYTITAKYKPDFVLPGGLVIECKGYFDDADRRKLAAVKKAHPNLDLRMVFSNSSKPCRKGRPGTYAEWCVRHGIPYADRTIPEEWLKGVKGK